MKTTTAIITTLSGLLISSVAVANTAQYRADRDPSGVRVCFTADGQKAPLASCETVSTATKLVRDPSGAAMCFEADGQTQLSLSECDGELSASLEPNLLDALPDNGAARAAAQFAAAVNNDDARTFNRLVHPRGLHHGAKMVAARGIKQVVRTLGVASYVGMPADAPWNLRSETNWFSMFRGDGAGNTTIAYFERYKKEWRLVQIARVRFDKTASR